jgi:anaerobic selenocysteine-containing dehydrogenase
MHSPTNRSPSAGQPKREATRIKLVGPHNCLDTCGLVITVRNGRAVELRGDTEHPFTRGFLCQNVARDRERVYHPERLK